MKIYIISAIAILLASCASTKENSLCIKKDTGHFSIENNILKFTATGCYGGQHEWLVSKKVRERFL